MVYTQLKLNDGSMLMAVRTTEVAVRQILSTSLTTEQIVRFIRDASLWVDEELVVFNLSPSRLELIERYLACSLVRLRDLGLKSLKLDDISEQYQVDPDVTDYLKRAASFDSTGSVMKSFMPSKSKIASSARGKGFLEDARADAAGEVE